VKRSPASGDAFEVVYFRRHKANDPAEAIPGREFMGSCPPAVKIKLQNIVIAVAAAPPHKFAGGGGWEIMHGKMAGYYEVRADGPKRHHYRLFCRLDSTAENRGPLLVILCGADKPFKTELTDAEYAAVRALGDEYLGRNPRSLA
jgi:hypothetical protein